MKYFIVDIRYYWVFFGVDKFLYMKKGVCLDRIKFSRLKVFLFELYDCVFELSDVELCMFSEFYKN